MISWEKKMTEQIVTQSDVEYLRILLTRETNMVEAAKLQKELQEKEALLYLQHEARLKEIENDGKGLVGSR